MCRHVAHRRASGLEARRRGERRAASTAHLVLARRPAALGFPLSGVASGLFFRGRPQLPWHRGREEASLMLPAEKEEENLSTVPRPSLLLSACCFSLWMLLFRERRASCKANTHNQRRLSTASKLSHCLINLPLSRVESSTSSRWKKRKHSVSLFGNPTTFLPSSLPLTSSSPPWRRHRY